MSKYGEPWRADNFNRCGAGCSADEPFLDCRIIDDGDLERAVACVNACEGIENPQEWVEGMRDRIAELEKLLRDIHDMLPKIVSASQWKRVAVQLQAQIAAALEGKHEN
jgi:hypothetical protein